MQHIPDKLFQILQELSETYAKDVQTRRMTELRLERDRRIQLEQAEHRLILTERKLEVDQLKKKQS